MSRFIMFRGERATYTALMVTFEMQGVYIQDLFNVENNSR